MNIWLYNSFAPTGDAEMKRQVLAWASSKKVSVDLLVDTGSNITKRQTVAIAAKGYPDLWDSGSATYHQFLGSGAYVETTPLYKEISKRYTGGWYQNAKKIAEVSKKGNKTWVVPYTADTNLLMYRGDVQEQKKLPVWETWEDLYNISKQALNPPNLYGAGFQLSWCSDNEDLWSQMIVAYGGKMTDESGEKITIDSPETREALTFIRKTYFDKSINSYAPGVFQWDNASDNTCYQEGHCYVINNPASVLLWLASNDKKLLTATKSTRGAFASKNKKIHNDFLGMSDGLVILNSKQTNTIDLSHDLVSYLLTPANYEKLIEAHMYLPFLQSKGLEALPRWKDPNHKALLDLIPHAIWNGWPAELSIPYGEFKNRLPTAYMITRMVQQNWSVDKSLAEYVKTAKGIWAQNGIKQ